MDYCDICDGTVVLKEVMGRQMSKCLDCGNTIEVSVTPAKSTTRVTYRKSSTKVTAQCPYCNHVYTDMQYLAAMQEVHIAEEHPEVWEVENMSDEDLVFNASYEGDYRKAKLALNHIEYDEDLKLVVIQTHHDKIREEAIHNIKDIRTIRDLLNMVKSPHVRQLLIKRRDDLKFE